MKDEPPQPGEIFLEVGDEFDARRRLRKGYHRFEVRATGGVTTWWILDDQMVAFLNWVSGHNLRSAFLWYAVASEAYEKMGPNEAFVAHALEAEAGLGRKEAEQAAARLMIALRRGSPR